MLVQVLMSFFVFLATCVVCRGDHDIAGRVLDPIGSPLPSVRVALQSLSPPRSFSTLTAENGNYHFDCVPDGEYQLLFDAGNNFLTTSIGGVEYAYPEPVVIDVKMMLKPGFGTIYATGSFLVVHIFDAATSKPIQGVTLALEGHEPRQTDACGRSWALLPPGEYQLRLEKAGYSAKVVKAVVEDEPLRIDLHLEPIRLDR